MTSYHDPIIFSNLDTLHLKALPMLFSLVFTVAITQNKCSGFNKNNLTYFFYTELISHQWLNFQFLGTHATRYCLYKKFNFHQISTLKLDTMHTPFTPSIVFELCFPLEKLSYNVRCISRWEGRGGVTITPCSNKQILRTNPALY